MSRNEVTRGLRIWVVLLALLAIAGPARADVFNLGNYSFYKSEEAGAYELIAEVPSAVATNDPVIFPEGCRQLSRDRQGLGGRAQFSFALRCDRPIARGDTIRTPWAVDGATFVSTATGARIQSALPVRDGVVTLPIGETVVTARPIGAIAGEYTWQGILHILGGWDHLAFVLCLCLLTRGRTLLLLVTTFTLGHSISLALAFFDVIHVPPPPVEAVIALSIAFMAREALLARHVGDEDRGTRLRYMAVVGSFGLLHGLGFASVLGALGVAPAEKVGGLVFFNLGVEIGQLVFVACVLAIMGVAGALGRGPLVRNAALYGAGILGCFWMIERVVGFTNGAA
jgi:hypothetical protein